MLIALILLYTLTTSAALVCLKLGSKSGALVSFAENGKFLFNFTAYSVIGIILYGLSFLIYTFLVSKYDLGFIVPVVTGLVYIAVFTSSFFIFNEQFSLIKISGIALILLGVFLISVRS